MNLSVVQELKLDAVLSLNGAGISVKSNVKEQRDNQVGRLSRKLVHFHVILPQSSGSCNENILEGNNRKACLISNS